MRSSVVYEALEEHPTRIVASALGVPGQGFGRPTIRKTDPSVARSFADLTNWPRRRGFDLSWGMLSPPEFSRPFFSDDS